MSDDAEHLLFRARVTDAGGGCVDLLVDRDTEDYPPLGAHVVVLDIQSYHRLVGRASRSSPPSWRTRLACWSRGIPTRRVALPGEPE